MAYCAHAASCAAYALLGRFLPRLGPLVLRRPPFILGPLFSHNVLVIGLLILRPRRAVARQNRRGLACRQSLNRPRELMRAAKARNDAHPYKERG
jgi:hypothetical protein